MDQPMNLPDTSTESMQRSVWIFFLLVFLLSAPFYVLDALFGEAWAEMIPINLPLSALLFVTPLVAAVILTHREQGGAGVKALLKRAFDIRRIKNKRWYAVALGLWPAIMLVEYGIMTLAGVPLPEYEFVWWMLPAFFAVFIVSGIFEEVGWTGYATDRLQERYTALQTSLIIGIVWALLHVTADVQADQTVSWIVWQRLGTIVIRILTVWLYNNAGRSVFATVLFHATSNVAMFAFPNYGSHYDPFLTLLILLVIAAFAVVGWGPETLARYRYGRLKGPLASA